MRWGMVIPRGSAAGEAPRSAVACTCYRYTYSEGGESLFIVLRYAQVYTAMAASSNVDVSDTKIPEFPCILCTRTIYTGG